MGYGDHNEIVVLCATRGRPDNTAQMLATFRRTATLLSTEMILVVDEDDPELAGYRKLPGQFEHESSGPLWPPDSIRVMEIPVNETGNMAAASNAAARRIWDSDCIIGHIGDDHRFETVGWDQMVREALTTPGFVYGDDGFWGQRLPTAVFMSSIIPRTLGWLALPTSHHYGIDDAWGDMGRQLHRIKYLPEMKIIQPGPGETAQNGDDIYWRAQENRRNDEIAYFTWRDKGQMRRDVLLLKSVLDG